MLFRFEGLIPNFGLREDGVYDLAFAIDGTRVELHSERGDYAWQLQCVATKDLEPGPEVKSMFESLAAGRHPGTGQPLEKWPEPIGHIAPSSMPHAFQEFSRDIQRDLRAVANTAVGLLRWRAAELGPMRPLASEGGVTWSLGDGQWHPFPGPTYATIRPYTGLQLCADAAQDLQLLVSEEGSEPFAYELLREAWALRENSPRSALLIAIAALEVAVKQFIADRVAPAKWLVNNLPAPDVIKVLSKYLPSLEPPPDARQGATRFERPSPKLMKLLQERRDQRNDITHRPDAHQQQAQVATPDDARSAILAVRQVLLRLDLADGHHWAREYFAEPPYEEPSAGYRRVGGRLTDELSMQLSDGRDSGSLPSGPETDY